MRPILGFFVLFLISNSVELGSAQDCKTDSSRDGKVSPCVFPFILDGKTYNTCTNVNDNNGKFWCSTKVDNEGKHTKGNWGYCDRDGNYSDSL